MSRKSPLLISRWSWFKRGDFLLIIGDDASGRIPALIFSEFLRKVNEKTDKKRPKTIFIAGGTRDLWGEEGERIRSEKKERIADLLKKIESTIGDELRRKVSTLIVTDTLSRGQTLMPLTKALRELEIPFYIATISLTHGRPDIKEKQLGGKVFYGKEDIPSIWEKYSLGGVKRAGGPQSLHSKPIKPGEKFRETFEWVYPKENFDEMRKRVQEVINEARTDINILVERLLNKFGA